MAMENLIQVEIPRKDPNREKHTETIDSLFSQDLKEELRGKLKKTFGGGYSPDSVEDLVGELQNSLRTMKENLERQVRDLAAEKAGVSQECAVLREQLQAAENKAADSQRQIAELRVRYEKRDAQAQESSRTVSEENARLRELLRSNQDAMEEVSRYEGLLREKEQEIQRLNDCLEETRHLKREMEESLKERISQLEAKLADLEQAEPGAPLQELEQLQRQADTLRGEKRELQERTLQMRQELESLRDRVSAQEKETSVQMPKLQEGAPADPAAEDQRIRETLTELLNSIENKTIAAHPFAKCGTPAPQEAVPKQEPRAHRCLSPAEQARNSGEEAQRPNRSSGEEDQRHAQVQQRIHWLYEQLVDVRRQLEAGEEEKEAVRQNLARMQREQELEASRREADLQREFQSLHCSVDEILARFQDQDQRICRFLEQNEQEQARSKELLEDRMALQMRNMDLMEEVARLTEKLQRERWENQRLSSVSGQNFNPYPLTGREKIPDSDGEWEKKQFDGYGRSPR